MLKKSIFWGGVICLTFLTKFLFFFIFFKNNPCTLQFDSAHYHKIAVQLCAGKGFSDDQGNPQFYRVPGYPIFLALCYKCFGPNPIYAIFLQILLSILLVWLIFLLSLTIFPDQIQVARISSLVACFGAGYNIFPCLIFTELFFALFFTVFLILFLQNINLFFCKNNTQASMSKIFWAGAFLGIACLIRQVAPAMLCTSIFLLLFTPKRFTSIFSFLFGFLLTTGWWIVRNYLLTGYIFFGTLSGPHFLNHCAMRLEMENNKNSHDQAKINVYNKFKLLCQQKEQSIGRPLQEIERCLIAEQLAFNMSLINPLITIKLWTYNILKSMFGLYSSELLFVDSKGQLPPYSSERSFSDMLKRFLYPNVSNKLIIPIIYFEMLLFMLILIGFFAFFLSIFFNFNNFCVAFKIFPFIFSILFITLACGYARLRLPIESFLIILASKTWFDFLRRNSNEK